jgi:membrane-bound serine protease (ClpP class)
MTVLIVVLLVIGASLLVAEAHLMSYGVLGLAGVLAVGGGIVLWVAEAGGGVLGALALAVPMALVPAVLVAVAARKVLQVHQRRALGGGNGLVGRVGVVRRAVTPLGAVLVNGELWRARQSLLEEDTPGPAEGEHVVVEQVRGLTVSVRRAENWELLP